MGNKDEFVEIEIESKDSMMYTNWDSFKPDSKAALHFPELGELWFYDFVRDDVKSGCKSGLPVQLLVYFKDLRLSMNTYIGDHHKTLFREIRGELDGKLLARLESKYGDESRAKAKKLILPMRKKLEEFAKCNFRESSLRLYLKDEPELDSMLAVDSQFSPKISFDLFSLIDVYRLTKKEKREHYKRETIVGLELALSSIQAMPRNILPEELREVQGLIEGIIIPGIVSHPLTTMHHYLKINLPEEYRRIAAKSDFIFEHISSYDRQEHINKTLDQGINFLKAIDILEEFAQNQARSIDAV